MSGRRVKMGGMEMGGMGMGGGGGAMSFRGLKTFNSFRNPVFRLYFGAVGGAGALLSQRIRAVEVLAYEDLGPEAVRRLVVEDFPVVVVNDLEGRDLFQEEKARYRRIPG